MSSTIKVFSLASAASVLAIVPHAMAGFSPSSTQGIAVYWGQNSYGQGSGPLAQQRLGHYCANSEIDIIPLAFMNGITPPITNFANAGNNCTSFPDNPNVLKCPQIEEDIKQCQETYGKTILISLGGATYGQGGWSSESDADKAAQLVWDMFGPVPTGEKVDRPFGSAVVDGFDFDFESPTNNLPAFGAKLRSLIDASGGDRKFYLTSAPQCFFPDAANGPTINAVAFDFLMIQFYNNWCGANNFKPGASEQNAFNFDVWDRWAKTESPNKDIKLLLGIPAARTAAGTGYTEGAQLEAVIRYSAQFSSFGGVMMWDMSQLQANSGFLEQVVSDLGDNPTTTSVPSGTSSTPSTSSTWTPTTLTTTTVATTTATESTATESTATEPTATTTEVTTSTSSSAAPTNTLIPEWGQCGGKDWTGPTECAPPYKCIFITEYYWSCRFVKGRDGRDN
ncbi:Endochitinase 33 [Claviceps purpurea]|nr:Endochitinase 33 [Claviceps purpurea]